MTDTADLAIVGGGAAGLTAAIFAAATAGRARRVVLLDGAKTLGAKILVAGGGRCNVTHDLVTPDDFNGPRNIVRNVLAAFDARATIDWFASMGVKLKREETGKLFPVTDSARTVLHALLNRCEETGVHIRPGSRVENVTRRADGSFHIEHSTGTLVAHRLVLSTGGRSLPRSGSDGSGWTLAAALGHTVTPTYPALVPLLLHPAMFHGQLPGISHPAGLTTVVDGKPIDRRDGSLLWTHFGISGPVVMDASRHWVIASQTGRAPQLLCNFLPPDGFEAVEKWLLAQASARPRATAIGFLASRLPERVAAAVLSRCKLDPATPGAQLSRDARRSLAHALTAMPLPVIGPRGWNYAEVTAGGVPLSEINYRTMESRKLPNLYLAGEILDCDGRIGGFNFQWAWATGHLAGKAAAM